MHQTSMIPDIPRKIIHVDLDAFYCAVEEKIDPSLVGKSFAVGGKPDQRGVVSSCSYAARRFGVHSAMPMARALRLCPEMRIVLPHYKAYEEASQSVMRHLHDLTPLVEQVSIDEAFLDVSDLPYKGEEIAKKIQIHINQELGLPCSLGVATNKLLAKIANDCGKAACKSNQPPNAITVVPSGEEGDFLSPLPVEKLWGVGPKTVERLLSYDIHTIGDLVKFSEKELIHLFGKSGLELSLHARGVDSLPVVAYHELKSVSQEITFSKDVQDERYLRRTLRNLSEAVGKRLRTNRLTGRTVKLKLRWPDFTTITRQITLNAPTDQDSYIHTAVLLLFEKVWKPGRAVRLIGVGVSKFGSANRQLPLWDDASEQLQSAVDHLRGRFGDQVIKHGDDIPTRKGNDC